MFSCTMHPAPRWLSSGVVVLVYLVRKYLVSECSAVSCPFRLRCQCVRGAVIAGTVDFFFFIDSFQSFGHHIAASSRPGHHEPKALGSIHSTARPWPPWNAQLQRNSLRGSTHRVLH